MTRLGRRPQGAQLVESMLGSEHAKARLKAFLLTMSGALGVDEACEQLGIAESRFFDQRCAWLHESLELLEPRSPGRPRKEETPVPAEEVEQLRQRVQELESRVTIAETQATLACALPHRIPVSISAAVAPKKTGPPTPR
jgi:hypothetical protein